MTENITYIYSDKKVLKVGYLFSLHKQNIIFINYY